MKLTPKAIIMRTTTALLIAPIITTFYVGAVNSKPATAHAEGKSEDNQKSDESSAKKPDSKGNKDQPNSSIAKQKQACTKVRSSIANRTANLQDTSRNKLAVIDKIYANLQDFAKAKNISITDTQLLTVSAAKAAATEAIDGLGNAEDTLNCEDTAIGQNAAKLRLTIRSVNDSLKSYRNAVMAVLVEVKNAVGGTN